MLYLRKQHDISSNFNIMLQFYRLARCKQNVIEEKCGLVPKRMMSLPLTQRETTSDSHRKFSYGDSSVSSKLRLVRATEVFRHSKLAKLQAQTEATVEMGRIRQINWHCQYWRQYPLIRLERVFAPARKVYMAIRVRLIFFARSRSSLHSISTRLRRAMQKAP